MEIKEVWRSNFKDEMMNINLLLQTYKNVAIDTEFPGFLINSARDCSEEHKYEDLKLNVENLKLIQVGLTLFNSDGIIGGVWQLNFCNFDSRKDAHNPKSIQLLKSNGIDFERNKREGMDLSQFGLMFKKILKNNQMINWFTFHGLYDFAYLLKVINCRLPKSLRKFIMKLGLIFGHVYDLKVMAKYCPNLWGGELGLEKLSQILGLERYGEKHQAGSDSLLTACAFLKMKNVYGLGEENWQGYLYGISSKIGKGQPWSAGSSSSSLGQHLATATVAALSPSLL